MAKSRMRRDGVGEDDAATVPCSRPGCQRAGEYRAPLSRDQAGEFQYLCLDHVREFNRSWNFFEGWNREEIEAWQKADLSWHRPTWRPDDLARRSRAFPDGLLDDMFDVLQDAEAAPAEQNGSVPGPRGKRISEEDRRAFAILSLRPCADEAAVKRRFAAEVKACHPDLRGGDRQVEGRLRDVIWAYRQLTGRPDH